MQSFYGCSSRVAAQPCHADAHSHGVLGEPLRSTSDGDAAAGVTRPAATPTPLQPPRYDAWAGYAGINVGTCSSEGLLALQPTPPSLKASPSAVPAMLEDAVNAVMAPGLQGTYLDATFGRGAYTREILRRLPPEGRLIVCVDPGADPQGAAVARELLRTDSRVTSVVARPLGEVGAVLAGHEFAGVIADLASALQHDDALKGLSCIDNHPLDLRSNPARGIAASQWLKAATVDELAWVLHAYGEDDDPIMALRLAEALMDRQQRHGDYETVYQFVEVARRLKGYNDERGLHPGRLALQALRVFVNGELDQLQDFLDTATPLLAPGARLAIVTARRTEAALVKSFLRNHEDCHAFPLASCLSPRRLQELYPLLQTSKAFAVAQACQPLWPVSSEGVGRRPRSMATHVLQRASRRSSDACVSYPTRSDADAEERIVRDECALFSKPQHLPFAGASSCAQVGISSH